jgi:dephospho-CoA kinase
MRIVGLTGGIGTGKTSVASLFEKLGVPVIDADAITHALQERGSPLLALIVEAFGPGVLSPDGSLDRGGLGDLVFRDAEARARLNAIVHPAVGAETARRLAAAREAGAPLVILDVPLLFEVGGRARVGVEAVILVYAREEQQIERQMARDGCSREAAERRVRAQLPIEEKRALADFVIDNSGSPAETERQVRELHARLVRRGG